MFTVRLFAEKPVGVRGWLEKFQDILLAIAVLLAVMQIVSGDELRAHLASLKKPAGEPLYEPPSAVRLNAKMFQKHK